MTPRSGSTGWCEVRSTCRALTPTPQTTSSRRSRGAWGVGAGAGGGGARARAGRVGGGAGRGGAPPVLTLEEGPGAFADLVRGPSAQIKVFLSGSGPQLQNGTPSGTTGGATGAR